MKFIDPHIHMVCRTTDDYQRMAESGCIAVTEPAFWAGFDRKSAASFEDYFDQLTAWEPKRAVKYGLKHYSWICINPKEAEDVGFAREVIAMIPKYLDCKNVIGIGEIGLNKNSKNEMLILQEQIALAADHNQMVLVHTPHLEDKLKGTRLIMDAIDADGRLDKNRVLIDHAEEHTIAEILDRDFWAGLTLYPNSKCTPQRAADMVEIYGGEKMWINSAADWGESDPLSVVKFAVELKRRGHDDSLVQKMIYDNPCKFLKQSGKFNV